MRPTTSASNLRRRELCPGSARMEKGLPEEETPLSREGQLLHDYSAHPEYDRILLSPNDRDLLTLADELTKKVIERVESENNLAGKLFSDFIEKSYGGTQISGTPDFVRCYAGSTNVLVVDRKFGYNVVERAELNLQLRTYAVLTALHLTQASFVAIIQPRAAYDERITIAKYTADDLMASEAQILAILEASDKEDALLVPGEEQCRYCKAKLICPAFAEKMQVPAVITPDKALSKSDREAYLEQKLSECSDDQLEKVLEAVRLGKMVNDSANDEARKRIKDGKLTNWKLTKETEVRSVSDVRRALALLNLAGLPKDQVFDTVTGMSLTKLGEILRRLHPEWDWKQAKDWISKKLSTVIEVEKRKERVIRK